MNILIVQPKLETSLRQLEQQLEEHPEADIILFPEGYLNQNVELACTLAKKHAKIIMTGHKKPKDRAIIISQTGEILLDRAKYEYPVLTQVRHKLVGFMLCDELVVQGLGGMEPIYMDFIVHPIGVGMFSDEQFDQWIAEAKKYAITYNTMIMGTSHADGSYRNSPVSIPIAYCLDSDGKEIFVAKNDTRSRLLNLTTKQVVLCE